MPGSFCMKVIQQGPRGFICAYSVIIVGCNYHAHVSYFLYTGDGRWRQVIRRCASVSDTGVTGVCNWGVYENGVYWEECYCSSDSCNGATLLTMHKSLQLMLGFALMAGAATFMRS